MTRYLTSTTRTALLADLKANGFNWLDDDGNDRIPEHMEPCHFNGDDCVYIGKIPAEYDQEGNIVKPASTKWHANVTRCEGMVFATEQEEEPETPFNKFYTH